MCPNKSHMQNASILMKYFKFINSFINSFIYVSLVWFRCFPLLSIFYQNALLQSSREFYVSDLTLLHNCQWENSLPTPWEDMAGAKRLATGVILAYRSPRCLGSPRSFEFSETLQLK